MCYCKSTELYDIVDQEKTYKFKENNNNNSNKENQNTEIFTNIQNKRQKQNAFYIRNSQHYDNFINTIESYSITIPYELEKIDYRLIKENPLWFHQNFVSKGIPCIIKNITNHWPAMKKWQDSNYLISKMGKNKLSVDITPDGYADSIKNKYFVQPYQTQMTFEEFTKLRKNYKKNKSKNIINNINSNNTSENSNLNFNKIDINIDVNNDNDNDNNCIKKEFIAYVQKQNNNLNEEFNELKEDISSDVNELFSHLFQKEPDVSNIWIGTKDSVTSLHKDNYENIFMVIKGEKHFTLIPPVYYPFMQPCFYKDANWKIFKKNEKGNKNNDNFYDNIEININEILNEDFYIEESKEKRDVPWISINPDLKGDEGDIGINIKKYHVIIESGDGLYLPPLWYHQVSQYSFEDDYIIGVNHWYDMDFNTNYVLYDLLRNLVDLKVEY